MITHVYICNHCPGDISDRTFECQYPDIHQAQDAVPPVCPRCHSSNHVARYFGHRLFTIHKQDQAGEPTRYVPLKERPQKGLLSIGIRADEETCADIERQIEELVLESDIDIVPFDPEADTPEKIFGLTQGSVERALFDIRHQRMLQDLQDGHPISAFYMPLSEQFNN